MLGRGDESDGESDGESDNGSPEFVFCARVVVTKRKVIQVTKPSEFIALPLDMMT